MVRIEDECMKPEILQSKLKFLTSEMIKEDEEKKANDLVRR